MKKPKFLLLYFLKMMLLGFVVLLITRVIPSLITGSLLNYKYGTGAIVEIFMSLMVLLVVLRYGNSYIFTEKKEPLRKAIVIGLPILIIGVISFIANIGEVTKAPLGNVVNLVIYAFTIGVAEEFLCRGWIQNEFIERYGSNRKGVINSIVCASLIFGLMHFANLAAGQPLFETTLQVLQAVSFGVLLGAIYYRTKNIWSTIIIHGFYDFSIMVGEVALYKDCTTVADPSNAVRIIGYLSTILIILVYTLSAIYILRREKTAELIEKKEVHIKEEEKRKYNIIKWVAVGLFIILMLPINPSDEKEYTICYHYNELNLKGIMYELHFPHYESYSLDGMYGGEEYNITFTVNDDNELVLTNGIYNTKKVIYKHVYNFVVIENETTFTILLELDNSYEKLVYLTGNYSDLPDLSYIESLKDNFKELEVPEFNSEGYITIGDSYEKIPFIKNDINQVFVIKDKDNIEILID